MLWCQGAKFNASQGLEASGYYKINIQNISMWCSLIRNTMCIITIFSLPVFTPRK